MSGGSVFGRGNQKISWQVIECVGTDTVIVAATGNKILSLNDALLVDTGSDMSTKR